MKTISEKVKELTPGILSVIPLIYVGWSDSVLSPSEMKVIRKKVESYDFLTFSDKKYILQWLNPLNPPSDKEFKLWSSALRENSKTLESSKKQSLIDLGVEMAKSSSGNKEEALSSSKETKQALLDLRSALGLTQESDTLLLRQLFPEQVLQEERVANFDVNELKKLLDGEQIAVRDRVRTLQRDPLFRYGEDFEKDAYRLRILEQVRELSKQGLSSYSFPKEYGGFGENGAHIAVFEMLGYGDLSLAIKFGVQIGLFGGALHQLGTEKHHVKYLKDMHQCDLLGCFAMTETGHGSNVKDIETTATYNHDDRTIVVHSPSFSAGKEYIGNAMHSEMAAVFAQLIVEGENQGVHCVLVNIRDKKSNLMPGVKVEDCGYKLGLNGVDNGRIWFDQVTIPVDNLLNKYGDINEAGQYTSPIGKPSKRFFTTLGALVVGRICVGLLGINASKVALTIACKYALKRRQFGTKTGQQETLIIDYPTHQARLFPLLAKTYAYYFALRDLGEKHVAAKTEEEVREIETLAAGLKSKGTWHATDAIQTCREACGGKGYLYENRFASLKADTDIFTTFEGDNTVLMQLVAKGLLTEFKQSFHDDGYKAVIRYLFTKVKHEAYEINPLFHRKSDVEHLLDEKFHFHAFNYKQGKTLLTLSTRMQKYLKRGMDPYASFLKVQNHMMSLGHSYIDQIVLNSFYNHVNNCPDPAVKKALLPLVQLYALSNIYENRGWYLENDYMHGSKSKAIRRVIDKLYQDIKPNLNALVDGFGIPDELISAPIALKEWS